MSLCNIYGAGEDRWLCTLLLQRGYRVEYSAASDAYTQSPEGFDEFYNQRRRWVPSTMANILDLLMDYKRTVKINDNISFLYIVYQVCRSISINRFGSQNL
jgi:chitin synthase